ncbi:MAG: hypothetical protein LLF28_02175 [Nitrospiraceae bacterium]|nr:hypothetical protein [Nitrospiraceae bacterium]
MPIYEYECLKCGETHEILQKFSDKPLDVCSKCGGKVKKLISNTSFVLKGTGWYKTDNAVAPKKDKKKHGKSDIKPEAKTETKSEQKKETVKT